MKTIKILFALLFIGLMPCLAQEYATREVSLVNADGYEANMPVDVSLESSTKVFKYNTLYKYAFSGERIIGLTLYGYNPGAELNRHYKVWLTCDYNGNKMVCVYDNDLVLPSGGTETESIPLLSFNFDTPYVVPEDRIYFTVMIESTGDTSDTPVYFAVQNIRPAIKLKIQSDVKQLTGVVSNQDGQPVNNAHIVLTGMFDNARYEAFSGSDGHYSMSIEESHQEYKVEVSAEGYATYLVSQKSSYYNNMVSLAGEHPTRDFTLYNKVVFKKDQRATIILPADPDPAWGRYYQLTGRGKYTAGENRKLFFEREQSPKANVPYIIFPNNDFELNLGDYDLSQQPGRISIPMPEGAGSQGIPYHVEMIGSYDYQYVPSDCFEGQQYLFIDETDDCEQITFLGGRIGACRACFKLTWANGSFKFVCIDDPNERYAEMLQNGARWTYHGTNVFEDYSIDESKTLNGKTYGVLSIERYPINASTGARGVLSDKFCASIGIRDEGGKMYVDKAEYLSLFGENYSWNTIADGESLPYETTADGELVLYDFTKQEGQLYCQLTDGSQLKVTKTYTLKTEDGISRRCLTLSNGLELIEGIGCTNSTGMLWWLNTRQDYEDNALLTGFSIRESNGNYVSLIARDYNAEINKQNGIVNKMLRRGRSWVYLYDNGNIQGRLTYSIEGDTLLGGYQRAKLYATLRDNDYRLIHSYYAGALHEKEGWIRWLAASAKEDIPLYSFGLSMKQRFSWLDRDRYVVNIDTITDWGDRPLQRIQLLDWKNKQPMPLEKDSISYWVDGVGSSRGLFFELSGNADDSLRFEACYDDNYCLFTPDAFTKESKQPSKFEGDVAIGDFNYRIVMGTRKASVISPYLSGQIKNVSIPTSVKIWGVNCLVNGIEPSAFANLSGLESVDIPQTVTTIGESAFKNCTALQTLNLPSCITTIAKATFYGCTGLTSITLPPNLESIGEAAFAKCAALPSITFPITLGTIGRNAFVGCNGFTKIDIPAFVTSVGYNAFTSCTNVVDVYCRAETPPSSTSNAFYEIDPDATLHVPAEALEEYKYTSPWSKFKYIVAIDEAEGINLHLSPITQHPSTLYDLQGRKVTGTATRGIYVKDGKKVVVK